MSSHKSAFEFIRIYGSHYLKRAKMGARYQENIFFSSSATETEMAAAKSAANSSSFGASASVSYSGFGVSASASASHKEEESSSSESSKGNTSQQSSSVSQGGIRQFGQIKASGKCGELLGEDNILFPVEYETEPIFKLVDAKKFPKQRAYLEYLLRTMMSEGAKCAQARCSSKGTCVVDQFFFDRDYKDLNYETIFKNEPCVCNSERMGTDCS